MKSSVNTIVANFNSYNKSFNAAIRWISDTAKEQPGKIPAAPAKNDKSAEAKTLRTEIKQAKRRNNIIEDCRMVIESLAVTANDLKGKNISALRSKVLERVPNVAIVEGVTIAIKFARLPAYLKNEIKDYATTFRVVEASWIESIFTAAENVEGIRNDYEITTAPVIVNGELIRGVDGDIVDANGKSLIDTAAYVDISYIWEREALLEHNGNKVATSAKTEYIQNEKAK